MDVLCVGHAAWDITAFVTEYPSENSKCETDALLECVGGPAANAAYLLASWGASCALAATVGADSYGDHVLAELVQGGVDVTLVRASLHDPTPVSLIVVNTCSGSRTVVNRKARVAKSPCRIAMRPDAVRPPDVLLFDGHELEASLEAMAMFPQARTILDAGSARHGSVQLAGRVDHLIASERFARELIGVADLQTHERQTAALRALHAVSGHPVAITCGERGFLYGTGDDFALEPAIPLNAIDTTAAGDIFHGAFAFAVWRGMDWRQALRLANAAAALSTMARGGRTSIPSLEQVQKLLARISDSPDRTIYE